MISPLRSTSPVKADERWAGQDPAGEPTETGPGDGGVGHGRGALIDLDAFPRATAELLDRRALLRRTDTKFLGNDVAVAAVLPKITGDYALLGSAPYYTLYFDTADHQFFHDHRRGRRIRHKVRIRHYGDRKLTYLEIKSRLSDTITNKHRIQLPYETQTLDEVANTFIEKHTGVAGARLVPALWINYQRITLLSLEHNERFTIDRDLKVAPAHDRDGTVVDLTGVAFFEIKQSPRMRETPVVRNLRGLGLRERSISKYCAGVIYLDPTERHNRLRPVVRALEGVRP